MSDPSTSPASISSSVLSSSPSQGTSLDSFSALSDALPPSSSSKGSGDSTSMPALNGDANAHRRPSLEETEEALRRYKEDLKNYTAARFGNFKQEIENRSRATANSSAPPPTTTA